MKAGLVTLNADRIATGVDLVANSVDVKDNNADDGVLEAEYYDAADIYALEGANLYFFSADKTLCNDQGISPAESARRHGSTVLAKELAIDKCSPWPVSDSEKTNKPDAPESTTSEAEPLSSSTP